MAPRGEARGLVRPPHRQARCVERPAYRSDRTVPGRPLAVPSALILEGEELALLLAPDPSAF